MRLEDFDYHLPSELIAQRPAAERDQSRLMVVKRRESAVEHSRFSKLSTFLQAGDLLVLNDTRVIKCRFHGTNDAGKPVELLLVKEARDGIWEALARPGKRAKSGTRISMEGGVAQAEVVGSTDAGRRLVRIESRHSVPELMAKAGHVPLPPYIKRPDDADDVSRYQTVYARREGAVAAPTAGLHFTPRVLSELGQMGIELAWVTLHVGPGTFRPVRAQDPREHTLDPEWFRVEPDQAEAVNKAKREGRRVICVGTTVARVMEAAPKARKGGGSRAQESAGSAARTSEGSGLDERYRLRSQEDAGSRVQEGAASRAHASDGSTPDQGGRSKLAGCNGSKAQQGDALQEENEDGSTLRESGEHLWLVEPMEGWTDKFIVPPYKFKIVDALLTNFHLPRTTLLMLVAALAGREQILKAYSEAVSARYRFYSYGDAMLIL